MDSPSQLALNQYEDDYPYRPQPAKEVAPSEERFEVFGARVQVELEKWQSAAPLLILLGFFLLCDMLCIPLIADQSGWREYLMLALFGVIVAQGGLLATGLVFIQAPFWLRLLLFWIMTLVSWSAWATGNFLYYAWELRRLDDDFASELRLGLVLPLVAIAVQAPLWLFRLYRGWTLAWPRQVGQAHRSLAIADYLVGTAIVGLSITAARLAVPSDDVNAEYWAGWSIGFGMAAAMSLLSISPGLWLLFCWRNWMLGWAIFVFYCGTAVVLVLGAIGVVVSWLESGNVTIDPKEWFEVSLMCAIFAFVLGGGLRLMRVCGLELLTKVRRRVPPPDLLLAIRRTGRDNRT